MTNEPRGELKTLERAIALRESGDVERARQMLLGLVSAEPQNATIHYHCAWAHDKLGLEKEAVPFYEKALALGLGAAERRGALLGLGSTYRTLGRYDDAAAILQKAADEYPDATEFRVFLAMALYNTHQHESAMTHLLNIIADTSNDPSIQRYAHAIHFYADKLNTIWD